MMMIVIVCRFGVSANDYGGVGAMRIQYGWVMVAIGALMGCVAVGAMMSLAVFLQPITQATGWSRAGVSSAMTIGFLVMGAGGFGWGALNDRYGSRPVVLAGSVLLGLGLVLASRAATQTQFMLAYGLIVGLSAGVGIGAAAIAFAFPPPTVRVAAPRMAT